MFCGGFTCSKNALSALNVLYILVAFILIGVATYGKTVAIFTSLAVVGGIIACGVFLLLIAIIGLIGAVKHHQVLLFFYMIILFLLFLVQFSIACACLAFSKSQRAVIAKKGWEKIGSKTRNNVQTRFNCCGFEKQGIINDTKIGHPKCEKLACCKNSSSLCCTGVKPKSKTPIPCPCKHTCLSVAEQYMDKALKTAGGIGLFFSFTEIIGVWLAVRYRNQKDPRANPSAFL